MNTITLTKLSTLYAGASYIVGIIIFMGFLKLHEATTPAEQIAVVTSNQNLVLASTVITYLIFSAAIIVITNFVFQKTKITDPNLAVYTLSSALIWTTMLVASGFTFLLVSSGITSFADAAEAALVWKTIEIVRNALGGGIELIGGMWSLLVSLALYRSNVANKYLLLLSWLTFIGGAMTLYPALNEAGVGIFVLAQVTWFFALTRFIKN